MKNKALKVCGLGLLICQATCVWAADPLDVWVNPFGSGKGATLHAVEFGTPASALSGEWLAVGDAGAVATSADGRTWNYHDSGLLASFYDVRFFGQEWFAVGDGGLIASTAEGASWRIRHSLGGEFYALRAIARGSDRWVAVGEGGIILSSPNGDDWSEYVMDQPEDLYGVAFNGTEWIAVGANGTILRSAGASWQKVNTTTSSTLYSVRGSSSLWIAVGDNNTILTSTDGQNWENRDGPPGSPIYGLAQGMGKWIAWGVLGQIFSSSDLVTWTKASDFRLARINDARAANGLWVAVGEGGTILISTDGVHFETIVNGIGGFLSGIAYGNNRWVAVGIDEYYAATFSWGPGGKDTRGWVSADRYPFGSAGARLQGVAYGAGMFVAVGDESTIAYSSDSINWTLVDPKSIGDIHDPDGSLGYRHDVDWLVGVAYGEGQWVAVGNGVILTSPDAIHWRAVLDLAGDWNDYDFLSSVTYAPPLWVAVGSSGLIATSFDAQTWTKVRVGGEHDWLHGVAGVSSPTGETQSWIAVGETGPTGTGLILSSTDGQNWQEGIVGGSLPLKLCGVASGAGGCVIVGINTILAGGSTAGLSNRAGTLHGWLTSVAVAGRQFTIAGDGILLQSAGGGDVTNLPILSIAAPTYSTNGFEFSSPGLTASEYSIEASDDLLTWTPIKTVTGADLASRFIDAGALLVPRRFYRIRQL
jgi:hypothetical protein